MSALMHSPSVFHDRATTARSPVLCRFPPPDMVWSYGGELQNYLLECFSCAFAACADPAWLAVTGKEKLWLPLAWLCVIFTMNKLSE